MYVRLKQDACGQRGITIDKIPFKIFFKGHIVEISKEDYDHIKKIGYGDKFDKISDEEMKKLRANLSKKAEKELSNKTKYWEVPEDKQYQELPEKEREKKRKEVEAEQQRLLKGLEKPAEPEKPKEPSPTTPSVGESKVFTEKEAFDLTRAEQIFILKKRGFKIQDIGKKEKDRVKQILDSNPA